MASLYIYTLSLHDALPILKKIITNNISLIILLLGALSNFLLILFLRKDFPDIFTPLSLYLTYLGILGGFGFLGFEDRKSTRLNSSHVAISYAVFCLKIKKTRACSKRYEVQRIIHSETDEKHIGIQSSATETVV